MAAYYLEILSKFSKRTLQGNKHLYHFLRLFLYPEAFYAEYYYLEIRVKTIRRYRYHLFGYGVHEYGFFFSESFVFYNRLVINILGRYIHQGKIIRAFVRKYIFIRNRIYMLLYSLYKFLLCLFFVIIVFRTYKTLEALQGEL